MSKRFKTTIQYIFFLGLGLFFSWLSVRNLNNDNLEQIKRSLTHSRQWLIIPVLVMLLLSHYLRALRWRLLIEPLGYRPARWNALLAVLVGYLINIGVPRLGEVVKCTLLGRYEKIPTEKLIGTIITERIIDTLTLLIVFALTLGLQPHLYDQILQTFFPDDGSNPESFRSISTLIIVLTVAICFLLYWLLLKKRSMAELRKLLVGIARRLYEGISSIAALKRRVYFIFLSVSIWALYLLAGYAGFFAFPETEQYGILQALTILSAGSVGMIASPGGIGAYAFLVQKSMQLYGLSYSIALAFGWLIWLAQMGVTLLTGSLGFLLLPWYNKKARP